MVTVTYRKMNKAPRDGTKIIIKVRGRGEVLAYYVACQWLREPTALEGGQVIAGDPEVRDCWRPSDGGDDIELGDALGWRPAGLGQS